MSSMSTNNNDTNLFAFRFSQTGERILASGIDNLDQATEDLESANRNLNEDVDDWLA